MGGDGFVMCVYFELQCWLRCSSSNMNLDLNLHLYLRLQSGSGHKLNLILKILFLNIVSTATRQNERGKQIY